MSDVRTIDADALAEAKRVIAHGGLIVLPTDTVYGIACDPCNASAIERLYQVKGREHSKPLQVLLRSVDDCDALGLTLSEPLKTLAAAFLPGALSPIAEATASCNLRTVSSEHTQAIRVPKCEATQRILQVTGPLAASSANRSGERSPQSVDEAKAAFGNDVDLYLDGGTTQSHQASTVVASSPQSADGITILREGTIAADDIHTALAAASEEVTA